MRPGPSAARRWLVRRVRRVRLALRPKTMPRQALLLLWLTALALLVSVLGVLVPRWFPPSAMVVVLLLGGFLLRMRAMVLLYLVVGAGMAFSAVFRLPGTTQPPGGYVAVAIAALLLMVFVRSRERLGVQGTLGDAMLVDLRDRLRAQGRVPELPADWHVETVLRPAFGDSFSGDFVVASRSASGRQLELVLVDVSGKGQSAGTRALLLSGAFGGLLGAMPVEEFLPAANTYLLRQDWPEGFATAVHLALDLSDGGYRISYAGHPPAAQLAGAGQPWELVEGEAGPALGLVPDADFPVLRGRLAEGGAMFVYTDGMVETPGVDLSVGTQALLSLAGTVCATGCQEDDAERLVEAAGVAETDDRALVLLWRGSAG